MADHSLIAALIIIALIVWIYFDKKGPSVSAFESGARLNMLAGNDSLVTPKPPIFGSVFGPERVLPATRYDERKHAELPRGGFSQANKRWYDAIYSGGTETILDKPGAGAEDVAELWKEDADIRREETRASRAIVPRRFGMLV